MACSLVDGFSGATNEFEDIGGCCVVVDVDDEISVFFADFGTADGEAL